MVYKVSSMTKLFDMGENCIISGSMYIVFRSERYTKENVIPFMKANKCPVLPYGC